MQNSFLKNLSNLFFINISLCTVVPQMFSFNSNDMIYTMTINVCTYILHNWINVINKTHLINSIYVCIKL